MCDIHSLDILPSQDVIDSVAAYRLEFDKKTFDYMQLLSELKLVLNKYKFMDKHDTASWMRQIGYEFLTNPILFLHAPLTYICAFLSEIFKASSLSEIQRKLTPQILQCALTRLGEFTLN